MSNVAVLIDSLQRLLDGECVIDPTIVLRLVHRPRGPGQLDASTPGERESAGAHGAGPLQPAIGERLRVSQKTLEAHICQILQKLQLPESEDDHRRVLAVLTYLRLIG